MNPGDELWVYQEYVMGEGWGAIGGYVPALEQTLVFQNRDVHLAERAFGQLAREHTRSTGNRLRLAHFVLEHAEELT